MLRLIMGEIEMQRKCQLSAVGGRSSLKGLGTCLISHGCEFCVYASSVRVVTFERIACFVVSAALLSMSRAMVSSHADDPAP